MYTLLPNDADNFDKVQSYNMYHTVYVKQWSSKCKTKFQNDYFYRMKRSQSFNDNELFEAFKDKLKNQSIDNNVILELEIW